MLRYLTFFVLLLSFLGCRSKTDQSVPIFNYHNTDDLAQYESLNLDQNHPNLLHPQISKGNLNEVITSWKELHQHIGNFLSERNFDWGSDQSSISLVHKIYFQPDGKVKAHFFRVLTEDVSSDKRQEFAELLQQFDTDHAIALNRDTPFAQCGKTRYVN